MKRFVLAVAATALLAAAVVALAGPFDTPVTRAASTLAFQATFDSPSDFYDRFDMGFSGQNPLAYGDGIRTWHGDHDMACNGPTTLRDVNLGGTASNLDFSQVFWYCAPGGDPAKGHVMDAVNTKGYNTAWFSPKPSFTQISKVCWDINMTDVGSRKWTTVLFISQADATRYPAGTVLAGLSSLNQVARGTGGFDLGYTDPDFRQANPNNGVFPAGGTLAGYRDVDGSASWFQNESQWTSLFVWPNTVSAGTDKAARFKHCLENVGPNTVRITQDTPAGQVVRDMVGQIPQDARRVLFSDDNYNPTKDTRLNPDFLTWHWDNIQVFTDDGTGPAPTTAPTTVPTTVAPTTAAPTTVATTVAPTTAAPTTVATTVAPTTAASTTVAGTVAPTTVGPIDLTAAPTTAVSTTAASTTVAGTVAPTTVATTAAPTTVAPTTVATTAAPTTVAPTTVATTAAPTTVAPTTVATTAAPTTVAPTTVATTAAPTTVAPTTAAPTTAAPTTVAPTTAAPTTVATTVAPTTAAPTTVATTVAPTTAAPTTVAPTGDTTPPAITITGGPAGTTTDRDAVITFTATDGTQEFSAGGGVTFTASLDGGSTSLVTSPLRIAGLPLGDHVLVIKATDQAGNVGSARVTWTVVAAPNNLTGRTGPARGSSAPSVIAAHKSALEAAIKGGGLGTKVADNVVVRTAVPPPAQEVLAQTGARTMENVVLGLTLIGLGLVLAGVASGFRRRTS